ncbi:hypothetical protein EDC04DRAFT_930410 [Pisolithus marmoratus]|nr:hypothetical protein EDC04DRAFT_930410 [Pisolithus marmoratus]
MIIFVNVKSCGLRFLVLVIWISGFGPSSTTSVVIRMTANLALHLDGSDQPSAEYAALPRVDLGAKSDARRHMSWLMVYGHRTRPVSSLQSASGSRPRVT